jgi:fluoroquinolone transport system permease protein
VTSSAVKALLQADSRLLWRDPLLGWIVLLPFGVALVLRILVPRIGEALHAAKGFDLSPFHPLIMGGYLMTVPGIVGMIIGFLLLDERDTRTLTALRVTPLSMRRYLAYRITVPLVAGTVVTLAAYPVASVSPLPLRDLAPIALVAGLWAPLLALLLATAAPNKVAGFAAVKVLNSINLIPIASFFVPVPLQYAAGILPGYWPMRALWSATTGDSYGLYLVVGGVIGVVAITAATALFERRLLRRG